MKRIVLLTLHTFLLFILFIPFTTVKAGNSKTYTFFHAIVDAGGSGDFLTVQSAIDAAPTARTAPWLIFIKNGTYEELVRIPADKPFMHLIGQDKEKTILAYNIHCGPAEGDISHRSNKVLGVKDGSVVVTAAPDLYCENISFVNTWGVEQQAGPQALAMKNTNDRMAFNNCIFRSFQDTWMTSAKDHHRHYIKDCFIEGAVDYFYGGGDALVENSTLYNVRSGSVIVAPCHKEAKFGYVFLNCTVDGNEAAAADQKVKLGRPWHHSPIAVYINTTMQIPIASEGWTNMGAIPALFAEYNSRDSRGNLLDLSGRKTEYQGRGDNPPTGSCRASITEQEATRYTYENIIPGEDGWDPRSMMEKLPAPQVSGKKDKLSWKEVSGSIGYLVLSGEEIVGMTTGLSLKLSGNRSKTFQVCAVNPYGALGEVATFTF